MLAAQLRTLSRRERQIMDVVYRLGEATANDVLAGLPDPPSYSAVRAMLVKLERKGHLSHRQDGARYVYEPVVPADSARQSALERVIRTFFDGSAAKAVAAILEQDGEHISESELDHLARRIEQARREGQ